MLEWSELPQVARAVIVDKACIQYNNDFFGAQDVKQRLERNEAESMLRLTEEDTQARDVNILRNHRSVNIAFRNRR